MSYACCDDFIELGVPPVQIISNIMEVCTESSRHTISEFRDDPQENKNADMLEISDHGISHLIRCWQILVRGFEETKNSSNQIDCASMVILKLCYSSKLPMPEEIIKKLNSKKSQSDFYCSHLKCTFCSVCSQYF